MSVSHNEAQLGIYFCQIFIKTCVVGAHHNRPAETIQISTRNIDLYKEISKSTRIP